jgi:hypothetical protein
MAGSLCSPITIDSSGFGLFGNRKYHQTERLTNTQINEQLDMENTSGKPWEQKILWDIHNYIYTRTIELTKYMPIAKICP